MLCAIAVTKSTLLHTELLLEWDDPISKNPLPVCASNLKDWSWWLHKKYPHLKWPLNESRTPTSRQRCSKCNVTSDKVDPHWLSTVGTQTDSWLCKIDYTGRKQKHQQTNPDITLSSSLYVWLSHPTHSFVHLSIWFNLPIFPLPSPPFLVLSFLHSSVLSSPLPSISTSGPCDPRAR